MTDLDPLVELLARLARDGEVSLAWVVAHAPEGNLTHLWQRSEEGGAMAALATAVAERRASVRWAVACARTALRFVPPAETRPVVALDLAEQWANGRRGIWSRLLRAECHLGWARHDFDRDSWYYDASPAAAAAIDAALAAVDAAIARPHEFAATVSRVLRSTASASARAAAPTRFAEPDPAMMPDPPPDADRFGSDPLVYRNTLAAVASLVRSHLPCPTLAQLREAFRRV